MKKMYRSLIVCFCFLATGIAPALSQDTTWQQELGGWVDDVYYENLFLGGSYYTRISLADIDNDGDLDMFYGGGDCGSLVYFENVGNAQEPIFELRYEKFPNLTHPTIFGGIADVDFADTDADGDLDAAFASDLDFGGFLYWNDGNAYEPNFIYRDPYGPLQGQSSVTLIDIDADGDYDYFSGHGNRDRLIYFAENIGTSEVPIWEHRTYYYQDLDLGNTFNFDFGDIDQDGDYDLLACKIGGNVGFYENIGTPSEASFILATDDFLPDRDSNDWLETPEFADIDGDGDLDLFLAGAYAHLYYFENLGVGHNPQFVQRSDTSYFYVIPRMGGAWLGNSVDIDADGDDDLAPGFSLFLNESSQGEIKFSRIDNVIPFVSGSFADLDADNDYDFMIPAGAYTVGYYENVGDSTWPVWDSFRELFPSDGHLYHVWSVTSGDLDNDGDYDLLVAHENSTRLSRYRNDGTPESYDFVYAGELYLPEWEFHGAFDALLDDIDNDGDLDLLIGETRINIYTQVRLIFYQNDGTPEEPSWAFITDDFQYVVRDHRHENIAPCLTDVDKDGDKDLVVTNNNIGMQLFLNPLNATDIDENEQDAPEILPDFIALSCYPNPFNSTVRITLSIDKPSNIDLSVYNLLGQRIASVYKGFKPEGTHQLDWEPADLGAGIYFLKLSTGRHSRSVKILYLK